MYPLWSGYTGQDHWLEYALRIMHLAYLLF